MSSSRPRNDRAVMASRHEPPDSLDHFPTPPWATRALFKHVLLPRGLVSCEQSAWEPACGGGHMVAVLEEEFGEVFASDIFPYSPNQQVIDFLGDDLPVDRFDWIITNPPFNAALDFVRRALQLAMKGACFLCRSNWAECETRYLKLFSKTPPTYVAIFAERVPMHRGEWKPGGSTATSYSWFIWIKDQPAAPGETRYVWIPPGCRDALTTPDDIRRFARVAALPLFDGDVA